MEDQRYQRGFEKLEEVNKEGIDGLIQLMEDIAPDLATYVIEFATATCIRAQDSTHDSGSSVSSQP